MSRTTSTRSASDPARAFDESTFAELGFALLPGFLRRHETSVLRNDVDEFLLRPREAACTRPHNTLLPLRWNDEPVQRLLHDEARLQSIRAAVGGSELRWISGYFSIKDANSGPLWWHQDWWCWDHAASFRAEAPQVALLCYLEDVDTEHGALRILPGSHRRSTAIHAVLPETETAHSRPLDPRHVVYADHPDQVTPKLAAGDAVLIDYRLLHGTHANKRNTRRDCMILNFTPSWSELPEDIRAHLISHPAQPNADEAALARGSWQRRLLPQFDGIRRDLALNRVPPTRFEIAD